MLGVFAVVVFLVTLNKEGSILAIISHVNSTQYSHIAGYSINEMGKEKFIITQFCHG